MCWTAVTCDYALRPECEIWPDKKSITSISWSSAASSLLPPVSALFVILAITSLISLLPHCPVTLSQLEPGESYAGPTDQHMDTFPGLQPPRPHPASWRAPPWLGWGWGRRCGRSWWLSSPRAGCGRGILEKVFSSRPGSGLARPSLLPHGNLR